MTNIKKYLWNDRNLVQDSVIALAGAVLMFYDPGETFVGVQKRLQLCRRIKMQDYTLTSLDSDFMQVLNSFSDHHDTQRNHIDFYNKSAFYARKKRLAYPQQRTPT